MREIKFRALWTDGYCEPKWVYGYLTERDRNILIDPGGEEDAFIIITKHENSVGQYTGLKDKNGKEIYEWDVVRFTRNVGPIYKPTIASDVGVVKWIGERASFRLCYNTLEQKIHSSYSSKYEVIGNMR